MFSMIKYHLVLNLRERTMVFWTLAFPLLLGIFFYFGLGGIDEASAFDMIPVAVVQNETESVDSSTSETTDNTSENTDDTSQSTDTSSESTDSTSENTDDDASEYMDVDWSSWEEQADIPDKQEIFAEFMDGISGEVIEPVYVTDKAQAEKMLEDGKISGIFDLTGDEIALTVDENGLEQSILKALLDGFEQQTAILTDAQDEMQPELDARIDRVKNAGEHMKDLGEQAQEIGDKMSQAKTDLEDTAAKMQSASAQAQTLSEKMKDAQTQAAQAQQDAAVSGDAGQTDTVPQQVAMSEEQKAAAASLQKQMADYQAQGEQIKQQMSTAQSDMQAAKERMETYANQLESIQNDLESGKDELEAAKTAVTDYADLMSQKLQGMADSMKSGSTDYVKEVSLGGRNVSSVAPYYFALVAMACLYMCFLGETAARRTQANISEIGKRISLSPVHRMKVVLSNGISAYLIALVNMALILLFLTKVVHGLDLSMHRGYALLTAVIGCLIGVTFGILIESIGKWSQNIKSAILIGSSIFCAFLAGLMISDMKDIIEKHVPIVNRLNPAALIADSFYCICVYDDMGRLQMNLVIMCVMSAAFLIVAWLMTRRVRYDNL